MLDIENIPLDDEKTWDLICSGNTKGIFQMESYLGRHWCKEIKPRSIRELADISAAIRPGTLHAKDDNGKSMTQVYCDRKHGGESPAIHSSIENITNKTHNVILYQEQIMQIGALMAGFNGLQVDTLRKTIGKKDSTKLRRLGEDFVEGCVKQGHKREDAEKVFQVIEKSGKYAFNLSITPETLVETENGNVSIKDVAIGAKIKCPDGYYEVEDKFDHGIQDVFEITVGKNKIKCTVFHKFLCEDGSIRPLYEIMFYGISICG